MYIDKKKRDLIQEIMQYDGDYLKNDLVPKTMKKMQSFLVSMECANTFRDIKSMARIEIKGLAPNGKERLLVKELKESYDNNLMEGNTRFSTLYPLFGEGIIKSEDQTGNRYTHFKVISQTEKTFALEINEYRYCNNNFYLCFNIVINELSKHSPFYMSNVVGKDVRTIFHDCIKRTNIADFTEIEKVIIRNQIGSQQNTEEEFSVILSNTIAHIRATNFLWDVFDKKILSKTGENIAFDETFYNNKYFCIKNWNCSSNRINDLDAQYNAEIEEYVDNLLEIENMPHVLNKSTVESVINRIVQKKNIIQFDAAVGFAFKSGLNMLEGAFDKIKKDNGKCNLIIGALQKYDQIKVIHKLDRATAQYINLLTKNKKVNIFTYSKCFYHGKFYYLADENYAFVIVGSTNISKTAFKSNFEMDILYILKKGSFQELQFANWYQSLKSKCKLIPSLNDKLFESNIWDSEFDPLEETDKKRLSMDAARKQICELSDEETQFRLNLWLSHSPTVIYEDISIAALNTYKMFVFSEKELVVFESFEPQNAFYAFGCPNGVENLICSIERMTKMQMTLSQYYIEKGNHSSNKTALKNRIDRFFE